VLYRPAVLILALIALVSGMVDTAGEYSHGDSLVLPMQKFEYVTISSESGVLADTVFVYMDTTLLFRFDTRKRELIGDIEDKVLVNLILYILLLMGR